MAPKPSPMPVSPAHEGYDEACALWQTALAQYLRLAREGAGGARLRAAAAAVHAAALRKARLARGHEDAAG
jgi:hypothetical protein